jgi:hypothetical protein
MHTYLAGPQFWFLSLLIVGADLLIVLLLISSVRRVLLAGGKAEGDVGRIVSMLALALGGWLALALVLAWQGLFRSALDQPIPYIALAIGIPILGGGLFIARSRRVREIIASVPQSQLVAFQFYRVLGVVFLFLLATRQLPGAFALPAGFGDLLVGLTALLVGAHIRNHPRRVEFVAFWNWFGIADLIIAIATGFLTAPSRFQILSLNEPNILIGSFPLVMIPIFAVPLSVLLHFASLSKIEMADGLPVKQAVSV